MYKSKRRPNWYQISNLSDRAYPNFNFYRGFCSKVSLVEPILKSQSIGTYLTHSTNSAGKPQAAFFSHHQSHLHEFNWFTVSTHFCLFFIFLSPFFPLLSVHFIFMVLRLYFVIEIELGINLIRKCLIKEPFYSTILG